MIRVKGNSNEYSVIRTRGDGAEIAYAIVDSALGRLLVARHTARDLLRARWAESQNRTTFARARRATNPPRDESGRQDPNRRDDSGTAFGPMRSPNTSRPLEDARRRRWDISGHALLTLRVLGPAPRDLPQVRRARTPKSRDESDGPRNPRRRHRQPAPTRIDLSSHVHRRVARSGHLGGYRMGLWSARASYSRGSPERKVRIPTSDIPWDGAQRAKMVAQMISFESR